MTRNEKLLDEFFREWNRKVDDGKVSPLDRIEIYVLRLFVQWLDKKEAIIRAAETTSPPPGDVQDD